MSDRRGPPGPDGSSVRETLEAGELERLVPQAARAAEQDDRVRPLPPCPVRTAFQRDRDRVLHSKAFRRLAHKTQVFLSPEGDHYRTRITHTLEVQQIARTLARGLGLNEDLTEAIALGHDLGHTPFGHAGEAALNALVPGGFRHYAQSLRVVEVLERSGRGLNLTHAVRDGIRRHSKGKGAILTTDPQRLPTTLEGQVVRLSDLIAYLSHDLDDALRGKVLHLDDLPADLIALFGRRTGDRIDFMVRDILATTDLEAEARILCSDQTHEAMDRLREELYDHLYDNPVVHEPFNKAQAILESLYTAFTADLDRFFDEQWDDCPESIRAEPARAVVDYLASMTDRYAMRLWQDKFVPKRWSMM